MRGYSRGVLSLLSMWFLLSIQLTLIWLSITLSTEVVHNRHKLNHVWTNRAMHSDLAKVIQKHQSQCSPRVSHYGQRNYGMGSDLHIWTQALCNSMQLGQTLLLLKEPWIWNDREFCKEGNNTQPYSCYFNINKECPDSISNSPKQIKSSNDLANCRSFIKDLASRQSFRAAAIEYLFSNLNPALVKAAEDAIGGVFGADGIPENLITLHLRWGDKHTEMKLVSEKEYYDALDKMITKHSLIDPHIYVTTESLDGLEKLQEQLKTHNKTWKLHHFAPAIYHSKSEMSPMQMAANSEGSLGKNSLVALLLAMEAKYYIVTSGSNWSRLIDELRKNVVDVQCNQCTDIADLREGIPQAQNWRS